MKIRNRRLLSVSMTTLILLSASQPAISALAQSVVPSQSQNGAPKMHQTSNNMLAPAPAPVSATVTPTSGTFGTAKWELDASGVLTIHVGTLGIQTLRIPGQELRTK